MLIRNTVFFIFIVSLDERLLPSKLVNNLILRIFQQSENTVEIWKSFWSARDTWHVWIVFDTRDEVSWPGEVSRDIIICSHDHHHDITDAPAPHHDIHKAFSLTFKTVFNFWAKIRIRTESLNIQLHSFYSTFSPMFPPSSYKKLTSMSQVNQTLHSSPRQW